MLQHRDPGRAAAGLRPAAAARAAAAPAGRRAGPVGVAVGLTGLALGSVAIGVSLLPRPLAALALAAVIGLLIMLLVGNPRKVLLAVVLIDIPLALDFNLGYRADAARLGAVSGWIISLTTIGLLGLYALWLADRLTHAPARAGRPRRLLRLSLPLAVYLAANGVSLVVAPDPVLALYEIFLLAQMFLLYVYLVGTVQSVQDVTYILTLLLVGLALESAVMIVVGITRWDVAFAGIATTVWSGPAGLGRTGGTVGPPNAAAGYLGVLLPAATAVLLTRLGRGQKILAAAALGLGLLALLFTFSRGGWIACAVALAGLGGLAWWRGWIKLPVVLLLAAGAGLVLVLAQDLIVARWLTNDPTAGRVPLLQMAGRIIADHPLLGVGANNFSVVLPQYVTPEFSGAWIYIVHNKYLLVLAEAGLGGLLAFLWFLAATVRQAWQRGRLADPLFAPLAWGLAAGLIGRLIHMNLDTFKDRPSMQLMVVVAALVAALTGIGVPQAQEERTGRP